MKEKYLPIGTVVRLREGEKNLMIVGFASSSSNGEAIYDYSGCLYPEGVISSDMSLLFNHDQIDEIVFEGFVNDEEKQFKKKLVELMTKGTVDGQIPNVEGMNNSMNGVMGQQFGQVVNNAQPQMFSGNEN